MFRQNSAGMPLTISFLVKNAEQILDCHPSKYSLLFFSLPYPLQFHENMELHLVHARG